MVDRIQAKHAIRAGLILFLCNAAIYGFIHFNYFQKEGFFDSILILLAATALCVISFIGVIKMIANLFKMMSDSDVQKTTQLQSVLLSKILKWALVKGVCIVVFVWGIFNFQQELKYKEKLIPLLLGCSALFTVPILSSFLVQQKEYKEID